MSILSRLILVCALLVGGCSYLPSIGKRIDQNTVAQDSNKQEIVRLEADHKSKLEALTVEFDRLKQAQDAANKAQLKAVAGSFFAQDALYGSIVQPIRTDHMFHNYALEGWAAIGNLMPDYNKIVEINARIKKELDETKTSLIDLKNNHQTALLQNQKLNDAAVLAAAKLIKLEEERQLFENKYLDELADKQEARADLLAARADLEKQRANDAEETRKAKIKMIAVIGGLALASLAGAIYSPVFKSKFAITAAVLGLVAAGVWYLQPWHVGVAAGIGILAVVIFVIKEHGNSEKTLTAMTNYLHEKGDLVKDEFKEWTTKYVKKKDGSVTTEPDKAVLTTIDNKLMASDRK